MYIPNILKCISNSSTDNQNIDYMSVHMMTIEKKYKVTMHFYGLIPMGSDKTGKAQADLLVTRLKEDLIFDKIQKNIVGFVSDGKTDL